MMSPKLAVILGLALLVVIGFAFHWWILDVRRIWDWLVYAEPEPADLPGPVRLPARGAGEYHPTADEWEQLDADEWEQLDADEAADVWVAELHEEPPTDWPASPDVWDRWWADMDGLERECLKVTRLRQREQQLWDELKAETRELCAA